MNVEDSCVSIRKLRIAGEATSDSRGSPRLVISTGGEPDRSSPTKSRHIEPDIAPSLQTPLAEWLDHWHSLLEQK